MKRHLLSLITGLFCVAPTLRVAAQTLYFDTNGVIPGSGNANGSWDGTNWTIDATGSSAATVAFSGTNTNLAVFSAGTDGTGTLTITQNANFDPSGITIEEGNIILNADLPANNRSLLLSGNTVTVPGGSLLDFNVTLSSSTAATFTGGGTVNLGGTFDNASSAVTISGTGTTVLFDKASTTAVHATGGTLTINAGNTGRLGGTFTGTIPGGLPANYNDQLLDSASISVNGTLDLAGFAERVNDLNGASTGVITNSVAGTVAVINANNGGTYNGTLQDGAGTLGLRKTGFGTLTIAGTDTHTGGTTIAAGTLRFSLAATAAASLGANNLEMTGGGNLENSGAFSTYTSNLGTAAGEVRFTGNGGFAASGTPLSIALNGGATLTHGVTTAFLAGNQAFVLGSGNANRTATLTNDIAFGNTNSGDTLRRFQVNNGNANIEGAIAGSLTGNGSVFVNGQGALQLSSTLNKYNGAVFVTERSVLVYDETTLGAALGVYAMHSGQASNNNTNYSAVAYSGSGSATPAFYNTIADNGYVISQALTNHSAAAVDFNTAPAGLQGKLSLGAVQFSDEISPDPLRAVTFTGTFAPVSNSVRLGGGGGILAVDRVNTVTGQSNLIVRDNGSVLFNDKGQNYTGSTTIDGGTLILHGSNAILATSGITVNGLNGVSTGTGTVATPTGTSVTANSALRLPSGTGASTAGFANSGLREGAFVIRAKGDLIGSAPVTLNGGVLLARDFDSNAGNIIVQNVTLGNGFSQIAHQPQAASSTSVDQLTVTNLTRSFGATAEFRSQFGNLGVPGDSGRITVTNLGGSAIGLTNGIIGGWATASTANTSITNNSFGRTFATLASGELSALTSFTKQTSIDNLNTALAAENWLINGGTTAANRTLTTNVTVNSLVQQGGGVNTQNTFIDNGANLTLGTGGILFRNPSGSTGGQNNFITTNTAATPGQITSSYVAPGSTIGELFLTAVENADNRLLVRIADNGTTPVALVKSGFGSVMLSRNNTFTGGVIVNAGELSLDHRDSTGQAILNGNTVTVRAGSRLSFLMGNATVANQDRSYSNTINLDGGTLRTADANSNAGGNLTLTGTLNITSLPSSSAVIDPNNARRVFLGPASTLTGSGNLVKVGDAALEIQTANTSGFTGNININAGFVDLTGAGKLPMTNVVFSGGSMNINTTNQVVTSLAGYGGNLQGTAAGTDSFETQQTINTAFHGNISNTNLILSGSGTLLLGGTGDNGAASLDVRNGTLILSKASSAAGARSVGSSFLISGGTARLDGTYTGALPTLDNLPTETNLVDQVWQAVSPTITGGTLDLNSRSESLNLLNGTGGTITNQGTGLSRLYVGQNGGGTGSFSGVIQNGSGSGTVGLSKIGSGTQTLGGNNTYSGTTNISGGILRINGDQTAATGAITVATGGTLGGSGTLGGALTVADGGTFAPGNSPGTLTTTSSAFFGSASVLSYELNGANTTIGSNVNDLFTGVTTLTLDGTLNVTETLAGSFLSAVLGDSWRLINYTGALTDNGLLLGATPPALQPGLGLNVDTSVPGQVNLVVVPEPSTTGLMAGLLAAFGLRRRRAVTRK